MSEKALKLTRRRALGALVTIGVGSAAAGAGTFAAFSDTEDSSSNTVSAGTLDLGSVSGSISASGILPGDTVGPTNLEATYQSSSDVDPVEVDLDIGSLSDPSSEQSEPSDNTTEQDGSTFAAGVDVLTAKTQLDKGSGWTDQTNIKSTKSISTADQLGGLSVDDAFGDPSPGDDIRLKLEFKLQQGVSNDYQADGFKFTATFNAEQPSED